MKIAVLGQSPAFPINIADAFSLLGEARLFCATPSDYRQQYEGTLLDTDEARQDAREFVNEADIIFVSGVSSLECLGLIGGHRWVKWLKKLRKSSQFVLFIVDTPYFFKPEYYNGLIDELKPTLFIMPDMFHLAKTEAAPLFYPHPVNDGQKNDVVTIIHSPGNKKKAETKGAAAIEEIIKRLQSEKLGFNYHRLMYKTYQETLRAKASAHIMIDKLPPMGQPKAIGNTGLEGMAAGMATITEMYDQSITDGYFERPPVIDIHNQNDLYQELKRLITDDVIRIEWGQAGQQWVRDNIEYQPWLDYVQRYL